MLNMHLASHRSCQLLRQHSVPPHKPLRAQGVEQVQTGKLSKRKNSVEPFKPMRFLELHWNFQLHKVRKGQGTAKSSTAFITISGKIPCETSCTPGKAAVSLVSFYYRVVKWGVSKGRGFPNIP